MYKTMIYQLRLYTSLQKRLQLLPLNCPSNKNSLSRATLPKKKNNANETIKKIHTHIPIPFSPPIKGDSGPPIMGPPYGFRFPYHSHMFRDFFNRTIRMGPKASHVPLGVPPQNSTRIQSPNWQKSKVRSTSSR